MSQTSGDRPLTARSVIASNLLGMATPALPARLLVRSTELFGISEGTTRVALSRMVAAGELVAEDGVYRLSGPLLERQAEQDQSRRPQLRTWTGEWRIGLVRAEGRTAPARAGLRSAMSRLRFGEVREGTWMRPDNLAPDHPSGSLGAAIVARQQCRWLTGRLDGGEDGGRELTARLWDLPAWAARAHDLLERMRGTLSRLEQGDTAALAPCFVLSAAVVRQIRSDPLLPEALLPDTWPGDDLRRRYSAYETAYTRLLRAWLRGGTG